ncbi:hypothetical protein Tco_0612435 [Tanacetum coccineum]
MAQLEFCDKHNMVAYLVKSESSEGFDEIIDFLTSSHIYYALTENPIIFVSLIEQFWETAVLSTTEEGLQAISATIDGHEKLITEDSLRRHLKLDDAEGISSLSNEEIFEHLAHMGYVTNSESLTFFKAHDEEQPQSPLRITSSPSISQQPTQSSPSLEPIQPTHKAEETASMPHDSPLHDVHSHGSTKGSVQQHDLTILVTKLNDRIDGLEKDLQQTKKTYSTALTKLVLRVKKLEYKLNSGKARRKAKFEEEVHEKPSDETEVLVQEETPTEIIEEHGSGEKGEMEISTANIQVSTASPPKVSTVVPHVYTRRSAKDKGKAIMEEPATPKKVKKRTQVQLSMDEELARKMEEEERIRFNAEQEARALQEEEEERLNLEAARELQRQLDQRQEVPTQPTQSQGIDWNDPSVLRYHALKNKHVSIAQARRNMITYLKNQGGYKESYFKKMSYNVIMPNFERVGDSFSTFIPLIEKKSCWNRRNTLQEEDLVTNKFPIVDWESQSLYSMHVYKIIRADGNTSYHKTFESMLKSFDRHDLEVLHRLVMERFQDNTPEGYNLMLWGDLKILVDPEQDDDIWKNQNQWKIISWKLYETCGVHTLIVDGTLMTIYMFVEKKYPLTKETLQKMLNWKLEAEAESSMAFEFLKFIKTRIEEQ